MRYVKQLNNGDGVNQWMYHDTVTVWQSKLKLFLGLRLAIIQWMQRCGIDFSIGYRLNYSHQVTTYFLFYLLNYYNLLVKFTFLTSSTNWPVKLSLSIKLFVFGRPEGVLSLLSCPVGLYLISSLVNAFSGLPISSCWNPWMWTHAVSWTLSLICIQLWERSFVKWLSFLEVTPSPWQ